MSTPRKTLRAVLTPLLALPLAAGLLFACGDDDESACDQAATILQTCADEDPNVTIEPSEGGSCSGAAKTVADCMIAAEGDCQAVFACAFGG